MRSGFARAVLFVAIGAGCCLGQNPKSEIRNQQSQVTAGRPNFLWISTEDISPDLGCYGDDYARTPNLDRLASEGMRFTNAFATAPVCAPRRSAIRAVNSRKR